MSVCLPNGITQSVQSSKKFKNSHNYRQFKFVNGVEWGKQNRMVH